MMMMMMNSIAWAAFCSSFQLHRHRPTLLLVNLVPKLFCNQQSQPSSHNTPWYFCFPSPSQTKSSFPRISSLSYKLKAVGETQGSSPQSGKKTLKKNLSTVLFQPLCRQPTCEWGGMGGWKRRRRGGAWRPINLLWSIMAYSHYLPTPQPLRSRPGQQRADQAWKPLQAYGALQTLKASLGPELRLHPWIIEMI